MRGFLWLVALVCVGTVALIYVWGVYLVLIKGVIRGKRDA